MSLAKTTLSSAVAVTDRSIAVASATSIAVGRIIRVDQEIMVVAKTWVSGTTIPVLRGMHGTATAAHVVTANVVHGDAADYDTPAAGTMTGYPMARATVVSSITATSSLSHAPAGSDHRVILNGTSVITLTVPVPTKDMDGDMLIVVGNGAAAHVVTYTGGVGGAGSSYDAFTVNATGAVALITIAANETWQMVTAPAVGGTVTNIIASVA